MGEWIDAVHQLTSSKPTHHIPIRGGHPCFLTYLSTRTHTMGACQTATVMCLPIQLIMARPKFECPLKHTPHTREYV